MDKICKTHGNTKGYLDSKGYVRCKKCRVKYVTEKRIRIKSKAVSYLGGKCKVCGYSKYQGALEFHHKDPLKKDFIIGAAIKSWTKLKEELDKCDLLCSNCHKETHAGLV